MGRIGRRAVGFERVPLDIEAEHLVTIRLEPNVKDVESALGDGVREVIMLEFAAQQLGQGRRQEGDGPRPVERDEADMRTPIAHKLETVPVTGEMAQNPVRVICAPIMGIAYAADLDADWEREDGVR